MKPITFAGHQRVAQHPQVAAVPRQVVSYATGHVHAVPVSALSLVDHAVVLEQPVVGRAPGKSRRVEERAADDLAVARAVAAAALLVSVRETSADPQSLDAEVVGQAPVGAGKGLVGRNHHTTAAE